MKFEHEDVDEIDRAAKLARLDRSGFIRMAVLTHLERAPYKKAKK